LVRLHLHAEREQFTFYAQHSNQQLAFCFFGLEHQPSPRGWAESNPVAEGLNFFFRSGLAQPKMSWPSPVKIYSKIFLEKFGIFPRILLQNFA